MSGTLSSWFTIPLQSHIKRALPSQEEGVRPPRPQPLSHSLRLLFIRHLSFAPLSSIFSPAFFLLLLHSCLFPSVPAFSILLSPFRPSPPPPLQPFFVPQSIRCIYFSFSSPPAFPLGPPSLYLFFFGAGNRKEAPPKRSKGRGKEETSVHAVVQWGGESLGLPSQLDPRLSPQRSPSGNKALETYICKLGTTAFTHKKSACTETRCAPHRGKENEAEHVIATAFCLVAHGKDNSSQPLPYSSPFTRVVSMPRVFDTHHLPTPISPPAMAWKRKEMKR